MAEAEQQLPDRRERCPRDLLRQFSGDIRSQEPLAAATEEDSAEIELSLGLSLGGCFGVDPAGKRGLHRSSSIAAMPLLEQREEDPAFLPLLKRTTSLPAEVEEAQRKRKELQCLLRLEAKRKRSETASCSRAAPSSLLSYVGDEETQKDGDSGGKSESKRVMGWQKLAQFGPAAAAAARLPNGVAAATPHGWATAAAARAVEGVRGFAAVSQGSVGSQGSSSSGLSDFGSRAVKQEELLGNATDQWRGTSSRAQHLPDLTEHIGTRSSTVGKHLDCAGREVKMEEEEGEGDSSKEELRRPAALGGNGIMREMMEEMPCVSTRGAGPNGRRVEGFLYRYGKGVEVRIVCVCHGRFLSPAEFVRHAGGGDVAYPLRHIMVNPSTSS